jgi:hypothetical protein
MDVPNTHYVRAVLVGRLFTINDALYWTLLYGSVRLSYVDTAESDSQHKL